MCQIYFYCGSSESFQKSLFIHLGYHFVFYMKVGCPTCVMLSMDKRKASFSSSKTYFQLRNHWVQRSLSLTYLQVDRLLVAMYDLENRYCVKQKLVSKNENEKKKKRKNFAKRIRKLFQKQYWLLYLKLQFIWCYYKRNTVFSTSFVCITKDWVLFHQMFINKNIEFI